MTTTTESMLGILTGELAGSLLQSALTGQPQGRVPGFRHEVDRVQARAGAETSVSYRIWYQAAEGEVSDYLVATTADVVGSAQVAGLVRQSISGVTPPIPTCRRSRWRPAPTC